MEPSRLEVLSPERDKGIFIARASNGYIVGPLSGIWSNDHITVGLRPDGDLKLIHRKIASAEVWRHTPETIQAEIDSFLANNISSLEWGDLSGPKTYLFSMYRRGTIVSSIFAPFEVPFTFLLRHMLVRSGGKGKEYTFDERRMQHFAKAIRRSPVPFLLKFMVRIPPKAWLAVGRRIFRFFLIDVRKHDRVEDDISLLVSPNRIGFVFAGNDEKPSFIPAESLLQLCARIEGALPFGKFAELSDIMRPGVTFRLR